MESYREVAERHAMAVAGDKAERVEAYMAAILATTDYRPDDYRLVVHVEHVPNGTRTHHWLEHKSVVREFAALPPEDD